MAPSPLSPPTSLPYWQTNLPPSQQPQTCPPFLAHISDRNKSILLSPQIAYVPMSWPEIQDVIARDDMPAFRRSPLDLRRYLEFVWGIQQAWEGGVMGFVMARRLGWGVGEEEEGVGGFEDEGNFKILFNDWPYGVETGISHLVVWTKFTFDTDGEKGKLTAPARGMVERFVNETFREKVGGDKVVWFHNWKNLKSVHAVEHFHVMLDNVDEAFLREITKGDRPLSDLLGDKEAFSELVEP